MKYECTHNVQMNGKVYKRGCIRELTPDEAKVYARSWKCLDAETTTNTSTEETEKEKMTRKSIQEKLDKLGIAYKARDTYEELLARLEDSGTSSITRV